MSVHDEPPREESSVIIPEGGTMSALEIEMFQKLKKGDPVSAMIKGTRIECTVESKNEKNWTLDLKRVYETGFHGEPIVDKDIRFKQDNVDVLPK